MMIWTGIIEMFLCVGLLELLRERDLRSTRDIERKRLDVRGASAGIAAVTTYVICCYFLRDSL
jgi:hypothetical protein